MTLDYCLIYRMVVIMENKVWYRMFISKTGIVAFFAFGVAVAASVTGAMYDSISVTEVLFLRFV